MTSHRLNRRSVMLLGAALLAGAPAAACAAKAGRTSSFADIGYSDWTEAEAPYRLYPGDQIEVTVLSAPELSRAVTVQPDGRIPLALIPPVMAADKTLDELERALSAAYAGQLLRPAVQVNVKAAAPLRIFVLGEVGAPGMYEMAGDINALQAVAQAGGFKTSAKRRQAAIIRRGPDGRAMMRTADLLEGLGKHAPRADLVPLRRFDIVYVPRSNVAEVGLFMQQYFRDALPISSGFDYAIAAALSNN